jgi:hypothetical protein
VQQFLGRRTKLFAHPEFGVTLGGVKGNGDGNSAQVLATVSGQGRAMPLTQILTNANKLKV